MKAIEVHRRTARINDPCEDNDTDAGLSEFAYDCFFKDWKFTNPEEDMTVDWVDNYDASRLEPMYLPAKYPLFLLNWHKALCL